MAAAQPCEHVWRPSSGVPGVGLPAPGHRVRDSASFDPDGAGPEPPLLVLAGGFRVAGNVLTDGLAAWDGSEWRSLGSLYNGFNPGSSAAPIRLFVRQGELIASGNFTTVNGVFVNGLGAWNGATWRPLGNWQWGNSATDFAEYGGNLYASFGSFAGQSGLARLDGATWTVVPGLTQSALLLDVWEGKLAIGGTATASGWHAVVLWDGSVFTPLPPYPGPGSVRSMCVHDGELVVGIIRSDSGEAVYAWNGASWRAIPGVFERFYDGVRIDDLASSGGMLFAAGSFRGVDGIDSRSVARWDGSAWRSLDGGVSLDIESLAVHNGELYASGYFVSASGRGTAKVARWDGSEWRSLGTGFDGAVRAAVEWDGRLVLSGDMLSAPGLDRVRGPIAETAHGWESLGEGFAFRTDVLAVHQGTLVGAAWVAGPSPYYRILRRQGNTWVQLGGDVQGSVERLMAAGDELFMAGAFSQIGGQPIQNLARWTGAEWEPLAPSVLELQAAVTGPDGSLFASGTFVKGGRTHVGVARRAGTSWEPFGAPFAQAPRKIEFAGGVLHALPGPAPGDYCTLVRQTTSGWEPAQLGLACTYAFSVHGERLYASGRTPQGHALVLQEGLSPRRVVTRMDAPATLVFTRRDEVVLSGDFMQLQGHVSPLVARGSCRCYADCDGSTASPVLNVADFTCFLQRFAAGESYANCDGSTQSPVLNIADFTCFLQRFAAGCP
jgi:hypothetical protein